MTEINAFWRGFLTIKKHDDPDNGKKIPAIHVYGPENEIGILQKDPSFIGTQIIPHRPIDEGGEIRSQIPNRK